MPPIFPAVALLAQGLRRLAHLAIVCAAIGMAVALLALYCF